MTFSICRLLTKAFCFVWNQIYVMRASSNILLHSYRWNRDCPYLLDRMIAIIKLSLNMYNDTNCMLSFLKTNCWNDYKRCSRLQFTNTSDPLNFINKCLPSLVQISEKKKKIISTLFMPIWNGIRFLFWIISE